MNIAFIILLIVLIIAIVVVSCILIIKTENELRQNIVTTIYDILDMKHFSPLEVHYVNRKLTIAVNKNYTKLAVIENFNPKNPEFYNYYEIPVSFIETIEKNVAIKILDGNNKCLYEDFGEMMFTHFGVTGPMILSASSHIKNSTISSSSSFSSFNPATLSRFIFSSP